MLKMAGAMLGLMVLGTSAAVAQQSLTSPTTGTATKTFDSAYDNSGKTRSSGLPGTTIPQSADSQESPLYSRARPAANMGFSSGLSDSKR